MKEHTTQTLAPLLAVLRSYPMLEEVRTAAFYLRGRDFIHFHETTDGVIADVLLANGRVSMPVASPGEQAELLERVEDRLSSLAQHYEKHHDQRQDRKKQQRRRPDRQRR